MPPNTPVASALATPRTAPAPTAQPQPVGQGGAGPAVARVVAFFEGLQPADLDRLHTLYAPDAHFKDPFNAVAGVPAIRAVFEHMFAALHAPRFVVTQVVAQGDHCFLTWEFRFHFRRGAGHEPVGQCILGATHFVWDAQGLITLHRDYWDAAEELYEKLPMLGAFMRWLKRRAAQ